MKKKIQKTNWYKKLLTELYFRQGLEELRAIGILKRKYIIQWSKTTGEKLCQIIFALICGENPKKILKKILRDEKRNFTKNRTKSIKAC